MEKKRGLTKSVVKVASLIQIEPRNTKKKAGTLHNKLKKGRRKNRLTRSRSR